MAVKKRCPYCLKKLRPDGTCATSDCPRYVPDKASVGNESQVNTHVAESEE